MSAPQTDVPLWAPDYAATFPTAIRRFWRKYATFSGRASHREYWWTYLFLAIPYLVSLTLLYGGLGVWEATSGSTGAPPVIFPVGVVLTVGWFAATVVPWLALEARRLHDANMSALLLLIHIASWPGALVVFILTQLSSNPIGRRFDAPPGEAPRYGRIGNWPAAPGEPEVALAPAYPSAAYPGTAPTPGTAYPGAASGPAYPGAVPPEQPPAFGSGTDSRS